MMQKVVLRLLIVNNNFTVIIMESQIAWLDEEIQVQKKQWGDIILLNS